MNHSRNHILELLYFVSLAVISMLFVIMWFYKTEAIGVELNQLRFIGWDSIGYVYRAKYILLFGYEEFIKANKYPHLYVLLLSTLSYLASLIINDLTFALFYVQKFVPLILMSLIIYVSSLIMFKIVNDIHAYSKINIIIPYLVSILYATNISSWRLTVDFHRNMMALLIILMSIYVMGNRIIYIESFKKFIIILLLFSTIAFTHFETYIIFIIVLFILNIIYTITEYKNNKKNELINNGLLILDMIIPLAILYKIGFFDGYGKELIFNNTLFKYSVTFQDIIFWTSSNIKSKFILLLLSYFILLNKSLKSKSFTALFVTIWTFLVFMIEFLIFIGIVNIPAHRPLILIPTPIFMIYIIYFILNNIKVSKLTRFKFNINPKTIIFVMVIFIMSFYDYSYLDQSAWWFTSPISQEDYKSILNLENSIKASKIINNYKYDNKLVILLYGNEISWKYQQYRLYIKTIIDFNIDVYFMTLEDIIYIDSDIRPFMCLTELASYIRNKSVYEFSTLIERSNIPLVLLVYKEIYERKIPFYLEKYCELYECSILVNESNNITIIKGIENVINLIGKSGTFIMETYNNICKSYTYYRNDLRADWSYSSYILHIWKRDNIKKGYDLISFKFVLMDRDYYKICLFLYDFSNNYSNLVVKLNNKVIIQHRYNSLGPVWVESNSLLLPKGVNEIIITNGASGEVFLLQLDLIVISKSELDCKGLLEVLS